MSSSLRLPNFLHLGPGKSGSTWLHEVLSRHPEVHLSSAKDLYFFSRYYDRGVEWYAAQFRASPPGARIVGEVCPDYLVVPGVPERVLATLGADTLLMVSLREPVDRAWSSYLYLQRHGLAAPTFIETAQAHPELLDEGRYGTLLDRVVRSFRPEQVHVATFDELEADPQAYLDGVTKHLGIARQRLAPELLEARLPASAARFRPLAAAARRAADWARAHDGAELVGRVKRSRLVERVLYRPLGADRPTPTSRDVDYVRSQLAGELAMVEARFDVPLTRMWGWS